MSAQTIVGGFLGIFVGVVLVLVAPAIIRWAKWLFNTRRRDDPLNDPRTAREWVAYPRREGDFLILGPGIFASVDRAVIDWEGVNYVQQPDPPAMIIAAEGIEIDGLTIDQLRSAVDFAGFHGWHRG